MPGLLGDIFSAGNVVKRKLADLLGNPMLSAQQILGNANDRARVLNELTAAAAQEKDLYGPKSQQLAGLLAEVYNPIGMTVYHGSPAKTGLLDYRIEHRPMTVEGGASRLHDAGTVFGEDVYGKNALQYFGSGLSGEKTSLDILKKVRGNPDAEITIYRGVPEGVNAINKGDWVTLDPKMAEEYGNVISKKVKARDITTWPDSLVEFGYYPD